MFWAFFSQYRRIFYFYLKNNSQKEEEHIIFALFVNSACYLSCYSTPYLVFRLTYHTSHTYAIYLLLFFVHTHDCYFYYYDVVLLLLLFSFFFCKYKRKIILFIFLFTLFIADWLPDWEVLRKKRREICREDDTYTQKMNETKNGNLKCV